MRVPAHVHQQRRCGSRAGKQLLRSVTSEGWAGHVVEGNLRSNVSEMGNGGKEGGSGVIEVPGLSLPPYQVCFLTRGPINGRFPACMEASSWGCSGATSCGASRLLPVCMTLSLEFLFWELTSSSLSTFRV
ncbi:hypothetical protein FQA47_023462 [Oryzias melastigma]|uniref:Uncharacterized protein n=1 Tax=Oryzias melastigma TaxID=30732 RepID=A0A834BPB7_ORYME|nr:hypothetical protein FQA47_023462 [Oryzias melastigma]